MAERSEEEKKLLKQLHQIRVEKVKEKLKLIESRENISILFKEWKAFEEVISALVSYYYSNITTNSMA